MLRKSTWCEISLEQFRSNLRTLKNVAGTEVVLVIKANAYGHGAAQLALAADQVGVAMFAVATLDEAQQVADTGTHTPIMLLPPLLAEEIHVCVERGWRFLVGSPEQLRHACAAAARYHARPSVHIKVDTGMGRAGVQPDQLEEFLRYCRKSADLEFEGIATHFAGADLLDESATHQQLERFERALAIIKAAGITPKFIHAANSPATLRFSNARFNLVRLGIAAYGLRPDTWMSLPEGMRPILSWKAKIVRLQLLPAGHGISYGSEYVTSAPELVATIPVGYADGYRRITGVNTVLYQGHELPVRGRVCMDQMVVGMPNASGLTPRIEDEVVLLGTSGNLAITADDLAARWHTNNYDSVAGIKERVPRLYR